MHQYQHHVSGIFQRNVEAESVLLQLKEKGLPLRRMHIYEDNILVPTETTQGKSNEVLKNMVVQGSVGTAVGVGVGALAEIALIAANVTLFVVSPLVAPIAMLGWGASVGATVGAAMGAIKSDEINPKEKEGWFSEFVADVIANGQVVLVVETRTKKETELVSEVMALTVNNYKDIRII